MTPIAAASYVFLVLVGVLLVRLFLFRFQIGNVQGGAEVVLGRLGRQLRWARHVVHESPGGLIVRVSDWIDVRIEARASNGSSDVFGRVDLTSDAGVFLLLAFLPTLFLAVMGLPESFLPIGTAEVVVALVLFLRGRKFARRAVLTPPSPPLGASEPASPTGLGLPPKPPGEPRMSELGVLLVSRLSQLLGLATEAEVALQARRGRALALAALFALIVLGTAFVGLVQVVPDLVRNANAVVALAGIAIFALAFLARAILRRRFNPRIKPVRELEERLRNAIDRESSGLPPEQGQTSTYELLAEASWTSPWWLALSLKEFLFFRRSPGIMWMNTAFVVAVMVYLLAILPLWLSGRLPIGVQGPVQGLITLGILAMTVVNLRALRRWERERVREEEERRAAWEQRLRAFRDRADGYLRGQ